MQNFSSADPMGFVERFNAAEFHWFFVQGFKAVSVGLLLPGTSSLLNGIEASLRFTISQLANEHAQGEPSPYRVLSNNLISNARDLGLPVDCLAFPDEDDFNEKLQTKKPEVRCVDIVRHRNDLCHGNTCKYFNRDLGDENVFFTPECLSDLAHTLMMISDRWASELSQFRCAQL